MFFFRFQKNVKKTIRKISKFLWPPSTIYSLKNLPKGKSQSKKKFYPVRAINGKLPQPIGHAAHVHLKDMRQGSETIFSIKKKSVTPPRPKGEKLLKHICAMVLLQDFVTFWGQTKIWIKKTFFVLKKYVNSLRKKKKRKNFFYMAKLDYRSC